jgi:hypothetical protein
MAIDFKVFSGLSWGKINSLNHADTQKYQNDDQIRTLKELFTLPETIKDGYNYTVVVTFEGDVVIGKKVTTTDQNGNQVVNLVGKIYVPAKSPLIVSGQYIVSTIFGDEFLAFQNVSSIDPNTKSDFEVNIAIFSPDPMR